MRQENNYWVRRLQAGRLSRRRFVGGAAAAGVGAAGLGLVGCGNGNNDNGNGVQRNGTPADTPAAQAPEGVPGGVSRGVFLGGNVFDSTDVHRAFGDPTSWLSNYVLNKVIRYENPDTGELEGDLAESYETPDAQVYTFNIRQNVTWQNTPLTNGRQLTAEDIKWHWERQAAGTLADGTQTPFRHQSFYQTIDRIEVPDEFTIRATLKSPNGTFLDRLAAYYSTVPNRETTERFEGDHRTLTEEAMPATGAYTLRQWRSGQEIKFVKNPNNFREGEPLLDGWIYPVLFEDPTAHRIAFEQKQVDAFSSPDPSVTQAILAANRGQMYEVLTGVANTVFLHLNMNQQFKDVRLVKAMNLAFDRRAMIQTFHQGLGQVSGPVTWLQEGYAVPPDELVNMDGYRTNRDEEIAEARRLWEAGGGPGLGTVDIKIPDTWLGPWPDTSQVIPNMLNNALGVRQFRSTRTTYNEEIIPNLANGQFPNWFGWTSQVSGPDPRAGLHQTFHSAGSGNFQRVNNPDLDRLLDDAMLTADYNEGVQITREAQDIILENGQYGNVILYNYINRSAGWNYYSGNLKRRPDGNDPGEGYNIFAGHLAPKNVWLDQKDPTFQGRPTPAL
jgi:ABC-type transport system substrate-binding protein